MGYSLPNNFWRPAAPTPRADQAGVFVRSGVAMAKRTGGRARQDRNRRLLAQSDVCHICGHGGSDEIDHVVPLARGGTEDPSNLRPAHGQQPCSTCGRKCNRAKSDKPHAPIIRRSGSLARGEGPPPPS